MANILFFYFLLITATQLTSIRVYGEPSGSILFDDEDEDAFKDELHANYDVEMDSYDHDTLKCSVCKNILFELKMKMEKIGPKAKIETKSFHLDANGNMVSEKIPLIKSEAFLTDYFDDLCKIFGNNGVYAKAKHKITGQTAVIRLLNHDKVQNPESMHYSVLPMHNERRSLDTEFFCEVAIEEGADKLLPLLIKEAGREEQEKVFCAKYCQSNKKPKKSKKKKTNKK